MMTVMLRMREQLEEVVEFGELARRRLSSEVVTAWTIAASIMIGRKGNVW